MPPRWAEAYLGDWPRLRCWDMARRILGERAGIVLPPHGTVTVRRRRATAATMAAEAASPEWLPVAVGEERELDLVLIDDVLGGRLAPLHVGVVTAPGWLIHLSAAGAAHLPFRDGPGLRGHRTLTRRVRSIHRHWSLAA